MWLLVLLFADVSATLPDPDVALYQQVLREHGPGLLIFERPSDDMCSSIARVSSDIGPDTAASVLARDLEALPIIPGATRITSERLVELSPDWISGYDWAAIRRAFPRARGIGWLSAIGWNRARTEALVGLSVWRPNGTEDRCWRYVRRGGRMVQREIR